MRKNLYIISSLIFVFIIIAFYYLLLIERDPSEIPSNLINKEIPVFKTENLIKEKAFNSSAEFGNEVVLVNFFATWCKPCRNEHAYIKKFSSKNIRVIGINYKDNPKKTINWLKKLGNPYSDIPIDKNGRIAIDWGVYGIPETFIVNSKGLIKYRHVGEITKKTYDKISSLIDNIN